MLSPLLHQLNSSISLLGYLSLEYSTSAYVNSNGEEMCAIVCLPPKYCLYLHITHEAWGNIPMHPISSNSLLSVNSEALQFAENITKA